jgi:hypothetical protein
MDYMRNDRLEIIRVILPCSRHCHASLPWCKRIWMLWNSPAVESEACANQRAVGSRRMDFSPTRSLALKIFSTDKKIVSYVSAVNLPSCKPSKRLFDV